MLLTTIVGEANDPNGTFRYNLPTGTSATNPEQVQINANGNIVAELVAAIRGSDGNLIFGNLTGTYANGIAAGNGAVPVTQGRAGSANPQPYANPDTGFNVAALNQVNLRGISSNAGGVTYAFNVFSQLPNSNNTLNYPITTSNTTANGTTSNTTANNTLWDIQLVQINNATGKATFIADLTNQLETGGNNINPFDPANPPVLGPTGAPIPQGQIAFLPDLLNAANVTIGGAAFNPVDGRLYFDLEFKPSSNITTSVGGNVTTGIGGELYPRHPHVHRSCCRQ